MGWITIAWSMSAGACLALAAIYLGVWCKQRESWVRLIFSGIALAAAAIAVFELQLIHADTPEEYGAILRWRQAPVWVLIVSLVGFTRLYLRAGRSWLGWSACRLKTLTPVVNFVLTPNLHYREITALRQLSWGGEIASVPVGIPNPWSAGSKLNHGCFKMIRGGVRMHQESHSARNGNYLFLVSGGSIIPSGLSTNGAAISVFLGVFKDWHAS
jgi:hypothetical protein